MKVYLVGAGPGDPGLITVKGARALSQADCVLYDYLANDRLLELAPAACERIYVGKKRSQHEMSQEEICALLVKQAQQGKTVVRLKGGDPFIFGRGGEEAEALSAAGIPFEIVPGVSTPFGLAAYTGVPLTHREHTSAVTFLTGHKVDAIDWGKAGASETVVVFMGLTHFSQIASEMICHGRSADTPAMAVRWATRATQETLVGTLATLPALIAAQGLKPPATIVIGEVVRLRERFNWFEKLPLFGKKIVVTRDHRQSSSFGSMLEECGAEVIACPVIEIQPPSDPEPLRTAIAALATYDWVVFTSVNGVRRFVSELDASTVDLRALQGRIAAIGSATQAALEALHLKVDLVPEEYVAESLVLAFQNVGLIGKRILLPRAKVARDVVPVELNRRGALVDVVEAYQTGVPADIGDRVSQALAAKPDWITFSSSSTVTNFFAHATPGDLKDCRIASIGPVTSASLRAAGVEPHVEAQPHTMDGLLAALLRAN